MEEKSINFINLLISFNDRKYESKLKMKKNIEIINDLRDLETIEKSVNGSSWLIRAEQRVK